MIQKCKAIVLRRRDVRETSVEIAFFALGFGKIRGLLRGVRGSRATFGGGSLEPFACDDIVFYERKKADLYTVSQCDLVEFFNPIRQSLERLSYASYIVELLDSVSASADRNDEVFHLLNSSLSLLSEGASPKRVARIFEIKLLDQMGLMPSFRICACCSMKIGTDAKFSLRHGGLLCAKCQKDERTAFGMLPGTARFIEEVRTMPFERIANIKVAAAIGKELEQILRKFLDYHIERRLKSLDFIKSIEH